MAFVIQKRLGHDRTRRIVTTHKQNVERHVLLAWLLMDREVGHPASSTDSLMQGLSGTWPTPIHRGETQGRTGLRAEMDPYDFILKKMDRLLMLLWNSRPSGWTSEERDRGSWSVVGGAVARGTCGRTSAGHSMVDGHGYACSSVRADISNA
jgi:hypothetical protein